MENKYYTPTIEEFHVGFECEIQSSYGWQKDEWPKVLSLDSLTFQDLINNGFIVATKKAGIRVKYLDKEDIESLGWVLTSQYADPDNRKYWWEIGKLIPHAKEMWHSLGNWKYRLSIGDNNRIHIDGRNIMNGGQRVIFNGIIKNKSELKKLMKQLNINEQTL